MTDATAASSRDALVTTSLEGHVLAWSRGAQALFGWRDHEVIGRDYGVLLHEKHRAVDAQSVAEVAAGHCVRNTMVKQVRQDGTVLACLQTMVPLRDATGRVTAVQRIVFDLSSLQEAERALRRALAQVHDFASPPGDPPARGTLGEARERTRVGYMNVIGGESRRLALLLEQLTDAAGVGARDVEHSAID